MSVRQYIGARYVPKIMGEWNNALSYEALSVVTYLGNSFTSKKEVPAGIDISDTEYWSNTGNYNAQVENYRQEVTRLENMVNGMCINALDYGFKNDGSNNDDIMADFIANDEDKTLYFPDGIYIFNSEIAFQNECHLILSANATLRLNSLTVIDYFISLRKGSTRSDYTYNSFIHGGTIDGNYKATSVISPHKIKCRYFLSDLKIVNVYKYGIKTSNTSPVDGNFSCMNISIENFKDINELEQTGTIGIYDNSFDNLFYNIEICNMETAIQTVAGRFSQIKAWIRSKNLIPNSCCVVVDGYDINIEDIAVDTYRYGFRAVSDGYGANITNVLFIWNGAVYSADQVTAYPITMFKGSYPNKKFNVTNMRFDAQFTPTFSDVNMAGYSSFVNVQTTGANDPITDAGVYTMSMEKYIIPFSTTGTTDSVGRINVNIPGKIASVMVTSPVMCFAVPTAAGFRVLQVDGGGVISLLADTDVTITGVRVNSDYDIYQYQI